MQVYKNEVLKDLFDDFIFYFSFFLNFNQFILKGLKIIID
jgi:hypothetical protein